LRGGLRRFGIGFSSRGGRRSPIDRDTEIEHLDVMRRVGVCASDQDVGGLQVTMDDPRGVSRGQSVGDLHSDVNQLADRSRRRHRRTVDEFHDQVIRSDVIQVTHVRVVQRRNASRFTLESAAKVLRDELDGDWPVETRVARLVDLAHAARADERNDFVGAEARSGSQHACWKR
jgi:hypothetical protein